IARKRVVLPQREGPTTHRDSPALNTRSSPSKTSTPLEKRLLALSTVMELVTPPSPNIGTNPVGARPASPSYGASGERATQASALQTAPRARRAGPQHAVVLGLGLAATVAVAGQDVEAA